MLVAPHLTLRKIPNDATLWLIDEQGCSVSLVRSVDPTGGRESIYPSEWWTVGKHRPQITMSMCQCFACWQIGKWKLNEKSSHGSPDISLSTQWGLKRMPDLTCATMFLFVYLNIYMYAYMYARACARVCVCVCARVLLVLYEGLFYHTLKRIEMPRWKHYVNCEPWTMSLSVEPLCLTHNRKRHRESIYSSDNSEPHPQPRTLFSAIRENCRVVHVQGPCHVNV